MATVNEQPPSSSDMATVNEPPPSSSDMATVNEPPPSSSDMATVNEPREGPAGNQTFLTFKQEAPSDSAATVVQPTPGSDVTVRQPPPGSGSDVTVRQPPPGSGSDVTVRQPPPPGSGSDVTVQQGSDLGPTVMQPDSGAPQSGSGLVRSGLRSGSHASSASHADPVKAAAEGELYAGKYELLNEIARGGMGVVYKARQVDLNRVVALKVMLAGSYASSDDRRRFVLEAEASAKLKHPHIVPVYDIGEVGGNLYFTMDYVEGAPLSERKKALDKDALLTVMIKVCSGVAYAHQRGIIHRDLKPANVMMDANDQPMIMDFGLAKQVEVVDAAGRPDSRTREGQIMGTPHYMPPEQAEGAVSEVDVRSDVWALGVMLYELSCGELPFKAKTVMQLMSKIIGHDPAPPRTIDPSVDPDLEAIVLKALEKDKDRRYDGAGALQRDLELLQAGQPVSARRATAGYRLQKWIARNRAKLLVSGSVAAVVLVLAGVAIQQAIQNARRDQLAAAQRVEAKVESYRGVLSELEAEQGALAREVQGTIESGWAALDPIDEWAERRRLAEPFAQRLAEHARALDALESRLDPFRESGLEADEAMALATLHAEAAQRAELAAQRERLAGVLRPVRERLLGLARAHARLERATRETAPAEEAAAAVLSACEQAGSTSPVPKWSSVAAALSDYGAAGADRTQAQVEVGDLGELLAAFDAAQTAQTQTVFTALSQAEKDSAEQRAARRLLEALQDRARRVAGAREQASDTWLIARMQAEAAAVLAAIAESRAEHAPSPSLWQEHLRAARLAQALVQRGLAAAARAGAGGEEGKGAGLDSLALDANRAYAEVLLDMQAYAIFDAEVANASAFREAELATLKARRELALKDRAGALKLLGEIEAGAEASSVEGLSRRLETARQTHEEYRLDDEVRVRAREVLERLSAARQARALSGVEQALAFADAQTQEVPRAERPRKLATLQGHWEKAQQALSDRASLLSELEAKRLGRLIQQGLGDLLRDAALEVELETPEVAQRLADQAAVAYRGLPAGDAQTQLEELIARLARRNQTPEGMVLYAGRSLRVGGGARDRNDPREVEVRPFYLSVREVVNSDYAVAVAAGKVPPPASWGGPTVPAGSENLPVTGISFAEALAYARSQGLRLPYDHEWEYAARATLEGVAEYPQQVYPWGEGWREPALTRELVPPGARALDRTPHGVFDLAGNVSEWVVVDDDASAQSAGAEASRLRQAARGASFLYPLAHMAHAGHRLLPRRQDYRGPQLGLRLAKDAR